MLRILNITAPDINNGNGVRVTLWVSGCKHHCKGCHNQWTWDFNQGKPLTDDNVNREISDKLIDWLSRDYIEGLTISGGDPLCQDDEGLWEIMEIIVWVHEELNKNVWIYTGYVYEDLLEEIKKNPNSERSKALSAILHNVDVLVDGPYKEELRDIAHTPFRGSTNQRIIKFERKNDKFEK